MMQTGGGWIDCCATLGRSAVSAGKPCLVPRNLLADMDRLGIGETCCADVRAFESSAAAGNRLLCEAIRGYPRLHPVWVVLPAATEELPPPRQLLRHMADHGVRLVRAEPARHNFSLREWGSGSLWSALESCRVPVLLDAGEQWSDLDGLLASHPALPVILTRIGYRCTRNLFPLLKARPNLHFELSSFIVNEGIAEVVRHFDTTRVLFGTDSPYWAPECAVGTLRFAGLADAELQSVAGGNLRRLIGEAAARLKEYAS